ncbi:MAG TPA: alpha-L-rhamnosidase C-terminal domain-containing protein [Woeseiaceae bacterium]|nr:alpha-L-rhamnosidase C-terminal domain-containing protein [Woeseiaceae bacterium]
MSYRRARFIWTPRQPFDDAVTFRSLLVHGPVRREDGVNRWFLFRRVFELPGQPGRASLQIMADSRYLLYVNSMPAGRGPGRATPAFARVDRHEIAAALRPGPNVLAVLVHVYGTDTAWYEAGRDYAQAIFGDGGLFVDASIRCGATTIDVLSDDSWRVTQARAWRSDTPRSGWGQGFIEDHDARVMPEAWTEAAFDDSRWDQARPLLRCADELDRAKGWGDIEPFPTLLPREIPHLVETPLYPVRVVARHGVLPGTTLGIERRIYDEPFTAAPPDSLSHPEALLRDDDSAAVIRTTADLDASVLLQFERRHCGYPFVEIDARGGEIIEIAAAETIPGEYAPRTQPAARVARQTSLDCAHVFRYTARAGRQRFEKFDWTAIKYLQLTVRNAPEGVRIVRVGSTETCFPVEHQGAFDCSDDRLNRLWHVGRYTVQQCTHDAWEDCPGREKRQWLGDGIVHYLAHAAAFGTSTQAIDRQFLLQATESRRTDGLLQMFAPGDHHSGGIVIPDFNLHWIVTVHHYLMHTGDVELVERVLPAVQGALGWFERQVGANGLLDRVPHWHFIEWARVGRDGEAFAINSMLVGALQAAAELAQIVGYPGLCERYREWAARVRGALRARHYDAARGVFVDSVDPQSGRQHPQVSQHANSLAILFDIAEADEWGGIVERITDERRLRRTAAPPVTVHADPFDPRADVVRANTFFCHFLYSALGKAGRFDLALSHMRRFYGPMLATGTETLWESFEPGASLCHAFSATPVYQLSAQALGVSPAEPGFRRVRIAPRFADLEFARGTYPTPRGGIDVAWQRTPGGEIDVKLAVPEGTEAGFVAPPPYRLRAAASPLPPGEHRLLLSPGTTGR